MKAMRLLEATSRRLTECEVEEPEPKEGWVQLELLAAGLCHTDVGMVAGDPGLRRGYSPHFPLTMGHEYLARVVALGPGTPGPPVGTRVVGSAHVTCRTCRWCRSGRSMLCDSLRLIGLDLDGAFAERFLAPAVNLFRVPDDASDVLAALSEPFAVASHAVDMACPRRGNRIAVVGPGAVGLLSVGALAGYDVTVVGRQSDASGLALAETLGARRTATDLDVASGELAGEFDVVLEAAGHRSAVELGSRLLGSGGRLVCIGLPAAAAAIDTAELARREQTVHGVRAYDLGTWASIGERLVRAPELEQLVTHRMPVTDVNTAIELVEERRALKVLLGPAVA